MSENQKIQDLTASIRQAYQQAKSNYQENGKNDYDSGVVSGLKWALEIIQREVGNV